MSFRYLLVLLLATGMSGCAGLRPVIRQSGPSVDAQTRAWQKKILRKGQDGDWLVIRGYSSTGDLVAAAGKTLRILSDLLPPRSIVCERA